jgi:hypothetical protein
VHSGSESGTQKDELPRAIAPGSTTGLDSSGACDGERWMVVTNALGDCG